MSDDCPDPISNLEDSINAVEGAFVESQIDAIRSISKNLRDSVSNLPEGVPPRTQMVSLCLSVGKSFDDFNSLRNSCSFNPAGCLRQVLDAGVLNGNPLEAGSSIAAATFVDMVTGNFTPPTVPSPSLDIEVEVPSFSPNIDLPNIPSPPPSDECPDPASDLNAALESAESTYLDLHKNAINGFSDSIDRFTNGLNGIPTAVQANALCTGINAGFDAASSLDASCRINVGDCIREVLESGIIGNDPIISGAALGAALFADSTAGAFPSIENLPSS